jgi:hypothetical protein
MHKLFITFVSALLLFLNNNKLLAQKAVYIPTFITDAKMDLNDPASQWSYSRSKQSDNIILFGKLDSALTHLLQRVFTRLILKNLWQMPKNAIPII